MQQKRLNNAVYSMMKMQTRQGWQGRRLRTIGLIPFLVAIMLAVLLSMMGVDLSFAQAGTTYYVTTTGSGNACTIADPCEWFTALDLATDDGEVRFAAGVYNITETIEVDQAITLTGGFDTSDWVTPNFSINETVFDGSSLPAADRIMEVGTATAVLIEGFTFQNAETNDAFAGGAAIFSDGGEPTIRNNVFFNNRATGNAGGAIGVQGGTAVIEQNELYQNSTGTDGGGAIFISIGTEATLNNNEIYLNTTTGSGGAISIFNSAGFEVTLYNNMIHQNEATGGGGGIFIFSGETILWNNTIAGNMAGGEGGGINSNGATIISNTVVVSNTGTVGNIFVNGGTVTGGYNNLFGGSSSATVNVNNTITTDPQFLNFATFNLRLSATSPNVDAGDPNTPAFVDVDIDGQVRPNPDGADPTRVDVGADEFYADVPDFEITPVIIADNEVEREQVANVAHLLNNIGTIEDSYTFEISNSLGWLVTAPTTVNNLPSGATANLTTLIEVPADAMPLSIAETTITATSAADNSLQQIVRIFSEVQPRPGLTLTPIYSETLTPGEPVTLTHIITNTGDSPDSFVVELVPDSWAELAPTNPTTITLPAEAGGTVDLVVTVPAFAQQGIVRLLTLTAVSSFDPAISATVVNTITAKSTIGTRYVALSGTDTDNNCTQADSPCRSISHAVGQAASGDEIRIQEGGIYTEGEINVNESLRISGAWSNNFDEQKEDPSLTIIDGNSERIFNIAPGSSVQPSFEMLTLQNGAATQGGAVFVGVNSQPAFERVVFQNNISSQGGAIYNDSGFISIRKSEFLTNSATTGLGGAIYHDGGLIREIENSLFAENTAVSGGAIAINNHAGTVDLVNNTFAFNEATGGPGGAIYSDNGTLDIRNQVVVSNTASSGAGGIQVDTATATVSYSNLFDNSPTDEGGNVTLGSGVISANPIFVDGYRPGSGSPIADSGDPATPLEEDFEGDYRPTDQGYDMGYDERVGCTTQRDDIIYGSIQEAIQAPDAISSLILVSGICRGVNTAVLGGETISQTVLITSSVQIQGGWNSDFTEFTNDETIIDPEGLGRAIFISDTVEATVENISLVNGNATGLGGGTADEDAGGNIYNLNATAVFSGVRVLTGTATLGGGFYNASGTATFETWEPRPGLDDDFDNQPNRFAANSAMQGGAFYTELGTVTFNAAHVHNNSATDGAGGYNETAVLSVTNVIFDENEATGNGGGFYNAASTTQFLHNTVYSNTAAAGGGYYNASGDATILSNIFQSNQATTGPAIEVAAGTVAEDYNYFNDQAAPAGLGANSIDSATPPGLTDPANDKFNLEADAPAVDAGDPASAVSTDYVRDPRPTNISSDIGADELAGCSVELNGARYGSIQVALELAQAGDEIKVSGSCSGVQDVDVGTGGSCGTGIISVGLSITAQNVTISGGWDEDFQMREPQNVTTIDAEGLGTAVYFAPGSSATLDQFHIINGLALNGAGICSDNASPTVLNSEIYSNTATGNGGGVYAVGGAPLFDLGNRIRNNEAANGAGVYFANTAPAASTLQNSFVYSNTASANGAGVYSASGDNAIWNNSIAENEAAGNGGGIYVADDTADIRNNAIVTNTAVSGAAIFGLAGSTPNIDYNNLFDNVGSLYGGTAGAGSNDVALAPGWTITYSLNVDSPMAEIGDPTVPITQDYEMDLRPSGVSFDIGADEIGGCTAAIQSEFQADGTVYGSIQFAVDQAANGDTILVEGTCRNVGTRGTPTVTQHLYISKTLTIDGGWDFQDVISATINPLNNGRAVYVAPGATVTLTNLIIESGEGDGAGIADGGGAIYNDGDLRLDNVEIHSSDATSGGAIFNAADLAVLDSFIYDNDAVSGGGIYNDSSGTAGITNTAVYNNNATGGGGIYQNGGDILIDGNSLFDNTATQGAGIYLTGGTADEVDVRNNFIYLNLATGDGGSLFNQDTSANIWHNSFIGNGGVNGAGLSSNGGSPFLRNNLFDNNVGTSILHASGGTPDSDFQNIVPIVINNYSGIAEGANDISVAPIYEDASSGNYRLASGSGGLDVGDPTVPAQVSYDIDGDIRPTNGGTDIGADELSSCRIRVQDPNNANNTQIFGVLQDAIDFAEGLGVASPTLEMARGECTGVQAGPDGTLQVGYIQQSMSIVGSLTKSSFAFTNDPLDEDVLAVSSRINAEGEGRVLYVAAGATVVLEDVAFVNGNALVANDGNSNGGGVYAEATASINFFQARLAQNVATNGGGYFGETGSILDVTGTRVGFTSIVEITENEGGSIDSLFYLLFDGNEADGDGGGVHATGEFDMRNVSFYFNQADGNGGGIFNSGNGNRLINVTMWNNSAGSSGGGLYNTGSDFGVFHNTYRDNAATTGSGGAIFNSSATFEINSSILYTNTAVSGAGGLNTAAGTTEAYNILFDNTPSNATITLDGTTREIDPLLGTLSLTRFSPALDTADPTLLSDVRFPDLGDNGIDFDRQNELRPDVFSNTGLVTPNQSDLGSNEYPKDFGCEIVAAPTTQTVLPGEVATYSVLVANVGTEFGVFTDALTVTLDSQTFTWSFLTDDGDEALLGANASAPYTLTVTVPDSALLGDEDVSTVRCQSKSNPARSASQSFTTVVGQAAGVDVAPDFNDTAVPGEVLTYTFTITNVGTAAGTFELTASPGPQFATADLVDDMDMVITETVTVELDRNESVMQTMQVQILETAIAGETAVPSLIATDINDEENFDSARSFIEILPASATRFVDGALGNNNTNCASPNSPCATLGYAYDQAVAGDEIRLAAGSYSDVMTGTINGATSEQTLYIDKPITLAGGYSTADSFSVQQPLTNVVTLSGQNGRRVVYITTTEQVTIEHLIIANGYAPSSVDGEYGGGILNDGSDLLLEGVIVRDNIARYGAGLYHESGSLTVLNSVLAENNNDDSQINSSGEGAGIYVNDGTAVVENNTFVGNASNLIGSLARSGQPTGQAGAFFQFDGTLTLRNNIFSENSGDVVSAVFISPTINLDNVDYNLYHNQGAQATNFVTGSNSFEGEPFFITADAFYRINFDSEAKDAGFNGVGTSQDIELDGRPQPAIGGVYDIGADERLQEPRFVFTPLSQMIEVGVNTVFTYTHILTNTGDPTDTYTFTLASVTTPPSSAWTRVLSPTTSVTLARNESVEVTLAVSGTQPGFMDESTISVESATGLTAQAVDSTRLTQTAGVVLAPDRNGSGLPGTAISYTHMLTNTGDGPDSYQIMMIENNPVWNVTVVPTETAVILPNEMIPVTVTVTISDGLAVGVSNTVQISATSDVDAAVSDSVTDTTSVAADYRFELAPDNVANALADSMVIYNHTLTNTGNTTDSFTLTVGSAPSWPVMVDPPTVTLAANGTADVTVTVTVPANTGGVQHIATVTAENSTSITETAVNTTTVQIDRGVDIEPSYSDIVAAGTVLTYEHVVTNTGNITETYDVAVNSSEGWQSNVLPATLTVGPSLTDTLAVEISVPGGAAPGDEDVTTITVTSQADGTVTDTVTDTTRTEQNHSLLFTPNFTSTAEAATTVVYTHTLSNTGNGPDQFELTATSDQGYMVTLPANPIELEAGTAVSVPVSIFLPIGSSGITDTTTITATSVISPAFFASVVDTTAISGEADLITGTISPLLSEGFGMIGDDVEHVFTITNTGNVDAIFTLEQNSSGIFGWTTSQPGGVSRFLEPSETQTLRFVVTIPSFASLNDREEFDLRLEIEPDNGGNSAFINVQNQTTYTDTVIISPGLLLTPNNEAFATPGSTVTYTHRITNTGSAADTFDLTAVSSNLWATTIPASVTLDSGDAGDIEVRLDVPAGTSGTVDMMTVTATSTTSPNPQAAVINTTTVTDTIPADSIDFTFEPDRNAAADAGTTVEFDHFLTNIGTVSDSYTVVAQSENGWTTVVAIPVSLVPSEQGDVLLSVGVPAGAAGQVETVTVVATSVASPTLSMTVTNVIRVNGTPGTLGVTIEPDNASDAEPGDRVFYQHTIHNTGTVTEDFRITAVSSEGWSATSTESLVQLAPGEQFGLGVFVIVPADLMASAEDMTTVTITSLTDGSVTDSAIDTTTVNLQGNVYLPFITKGGADTPEPPTPLPPSPTPLPTPCAPTGIDLVVTGILVEPVSPTAGEPATVYVTIQNQGSNDVPFGNNFFLDLYVNRLPQPIVSGDLIWGVQGGELDAGANVTFSAPITFVAGVQQLYAQVDTDNTVDECNFEANNTFGPLVVSVSGVARSDDATVTPAIEGMRSTPTPVAPAISVPSDTPTPMPSATAEPEAEITPLATAVLVTPTPDD